MNKVPRKSRQANYKRFPLSAEVHTPLSHSTHAAQRRSPTASFLTNQFIDAANPTGEGSAAPISQGRRRTQRARTLP